MPTAKKPARVTAKMRDEFAVDELAKRMKARLAQKRAEGYSGWHDSSQCDIANLRQGIARSTAAQRYVDAANYIAFVLARGEKESP